MFLPNFVLRWIGKDIAEKLKLQEGFVDTKKWYESKGIWTGIVTAVVGIYATLALQFHWPALPEWLFTVLGAIGIYSRATADTKIG